MKVKFSGNPINPQDNRGFIDWAGERFYLNVPRDLPEGKAFRKILKNPHFEIVEEDLEAQADQTDEENLEAEKAELIASSEKAELVAFAEEHGVKIDKRWSSAKIAAAIEAAAAEASGDGST